MDKSCRNIIKGIRVTPKNGFITVNNSDQCNMLIKAGLKIRNKPITLDNIWERSTVLQLSAVPPHVLDEQIIAAISRFADVIGIYIITYVEFLSRVLNKNDSYYSLLDLGRRKGCLQIFVFQSIWSRLRFLDVQLCTGCFTSIGAPSYYA